MLRSFSCVWSLNLVGMSPPLFPISQTTELVYQKSGTRPTLHAYVDAM